MPIHYYYTGPPQNFVNSGNNYGSHSSNISSNIGGTVNNYSGTRTVNMNSNNDNSWKDNSKNFTLSSPQTTKERNNRSTSLSSKGRSVPAENDNKALPQNYGGGPYYGTTPPERLQTPSATPQFDNDRPLLPALEADTGEKLAVDGFSDSSQFSSAPFEETPDTCETMVGDLSLPSVSE